MELDASETIAYYHAFDSAGIKQVIAAVDEYNSSGDFLQGTATNRVFEITDTACSDAELPPSSGAIPSAFLALTTCVVLFKKLFG